MGGSGHASAAEETHMSVVYDLNLKNTRMSAVVTAIDNAGAGSLIIGTAAMATELAVITFNSTCGTVSGGVLTFSDTPLVDASAATTGVAAAAEVVDGANHIVISGLTVGTSASDINMSSTNVVGGQSVTLTSATITHG
jgi:hypothetical protein